MLAESMPSPAWFRTDAHVPSAYTLTLAGTPGAFRI